MFGFLKSPAIEKIVEEEQEDLKTQPLSDSEKPSLPNVPLDLTLPDVGDLSSAFPDSFLDFESIDGCFIDGNGNGNLTDGSGPVASDLGFSRERRNGEESSVKKDKAEAVVIETRDEMTHLEVPGRINGDGVLVGEASSRKMGVLGYSVEELLGKVKIEVESDCEMPVGLKNVKSGSGEATGEHGGEGSIGFEKLNDIRGKTEPKETVGDEDESSSDAESEGTSSSFSSSSSSSSDEEEEEEEDEENDMEEGEIMLSDDVDKMVAWSDDEDADVATGPIRSKNELEVLPPVPSVTATFEQHHQTLPVGIVLSVIGLQVIVEGVEKHDPLSEGSILWITESRSPLGIIDEIFGPVKNPFYIVRYNSEAEVPSGIEQGTSISFIVEFANHVLNDKSLYQKGYDASGENDEELPDEVEFSDDEKEAEHRRKLKMKKRGTNENKRKDKRQMKNQNGTGNGNRDSGEQIPLSGDAPVVTKDKGFVPSVAPTSNFRPDMAPFCHGAQGSGFPAPSGICHGFQPQFQQNVGLPGGLLANGMLWMQQPQPYQLQQTPMQFQPQISTVPIPLNPFGGGVPGLGPPWTFLDPNMLGALQFGADNRGGEQTAQSEESPVKSNSQCSVTMGQPRNFNHGQRRGGSGGGRRGGRQQHRGRGRFGGGRGRYE